MGLGSGKWRSENDHDDRWNRENEREGRRLGEWRSGNGRHRWNRENERGGRRLGEWRSENGRHRWNRENEREGRRSALAALKGEERQTSEQMISLAMRKEEK